MHGVFGQPKIYSKQLLFGE